MDSPALLLTLRLALCTTAVLLVAAVPLAWWIASGTGARRALVQAVVALPLVLPPTVLGFYLLVALGADERTGAAACFECWAIRLPSAFRACWLDRCCTASPSRYSRWSPGFPR